MLRQFYEWKEWEGVSHIAAFVVFVYALWVLNSRGIANVSSTEWLLVVIALTQLTLVHQRVNDRNKVRTTYLVY
jgi:hypothetical protein